MVSCGSNWNRVNGFGTKQAQLLLTCTPLPFGLFGRE